MYKGVGVVIENNDGKLLILKRSNRDMFDPGRWSFPGGGIEPGEESSTAAKREAKEETNLDVEPEDQHFAIYYYPDGKEENAEAVVCYFKAKVVGGTFQLNGEHTDYWWVSKDDWRHFPYASSCETILESYFR